MSWTQVLSGFKSKSGLESRQYDKFDLHIMYINGPNHLSRLADLIFNISLYREDVAYDATMHRNAVSINGLDGS